MRLILVEPTSSENVGFVLRVCANFGVTETVIVGNRRTFDSGHVKKTACHAAEHWENVQFTGSLAEALTGVRSAVAFSGLPSHTRHPSLLLTAQVPYPRYALPVAFVFGREARGLTREELDLCQHIVQIHTPGPYTSMNLSHAVSTALFWWASALDTAFRDLPPLPEGHTELPATAETRFRVAEQWETLLQIVGFSHRTNNEKTRQEIHRLLARLNPSQREASWLSGIVQQVRWALGTGKKIEEPTELEERP